MARQILSVTLRVLPDKADPVKYEDNDAALISRPSLSHSKMDNALVILVFHATRDEAFSRKADGFAYYRAMAKEEAINFIFMMGLHAHAYKSITCARHLC
jgi:hypothetical protein